jgi:hypothetical protein
METKFSGKHLDLRQIKCVVCKMCSLIVCLKLSAVWGTSDSMYAMFGSCCDCHLLVN